MNQYDFHVFEFGHGSHHSREDGLCLMEAVAYLGGEKHSDSPKCASPIIGRAAIWLNDSYPDDSSGNAARQEKLAGLPYRIVGTADESKEPERIRMFAECMLNEIWPLMEQSDYHMNISHKAGIGLGVYRELLDIFHTSKNSTRKLLDTNSPDWEMYAVLSSKVLYYLPASVYPQAQQIMINLLDRMIRVTEPQEVVTLTPLEQVIV